MLIASLSLAACVDTTAKGNTNTDGQSVVAYEHSSTMNAQAGGGVSATVTVSVGAAQPAASVAEAAACGIRFGGQARFEAAATVPVRVTAEVHGADQTAMSIDLGNTLGLNSMGGVSTAPKVEWSIKYSDTPQKCDDPEVKWNGLSGTASWTAWLVVSPAISPSDPNGVAAVGTLILVPAMQIAGQPVKLTLADDQYNAVKCDALDPAAGKFTFFSVNPTVALDHGCTSVMIGQGRAAQRRDAICLQQYPSGKDGNRSGKVIVYTREFSLFDICTGFGSDNDIAWTDAMTCAFVATAADMGAIGAARFIKPLDNLCSAADIAAAYQDGNWLGSAGGAACEYFGDALAVGVGVAAAGATAETGPGAVAVGVTTYRALSVGVDVACGGALVTSAKQFGGELEGRHEYRVAREVINNPNLCIQSDESGSYPDYSAVACDE